MADLRTYIRLHDGMPDHPKIDGLSDRGFRLLIETWCWCSRHLTDGKVPAATWAKRGTAAARRELVDLGLVEQTPQGDFLMHDYLEHQRSADEVAAMREQRRVAGRAGGKSKAARQAERKQTANESLSESSSKTQASTETETEVPTDVGTSRAPSGLVVVERPEVKRLCDHLADRIAEDGSKRPTVGKAWADAARLMLDRDGLTEHEIHGAIDWCQSHHFWRTNILSMPKLREKFDQLRKVATSEQQGRPGRQQETDRIFDNAARTLGVTTPGGLT